METNTRLVCVDCGIFLPPGLGRRSWYFARLLCLECYQAEARRSTADNEVWVLEQLFRMSVA